MAYLNECLIKEKLQYDRAIYLLGKYAWTKEYYVTFTYNVPNKFQTISSNPEDKVFQVIERMSKYEADTDKPKSRSYFRLVQESNITFGHEVLCVQRMPLNDVESAKLTTNASTNIRIIQRYVRSINKYWEQRIEFVKYLRHEDVAQALASGSVKVISDEIAKFKDNFVPPANQYSTSNYFKLINDVNTISRVNFESFLEYSMKISENIIKFADYVRRPPGVFKSLFINPVQITRSSPYTIKKGDIIMSKTDGRHVALINQGKKLIIFDDHLELEVATSAEELYVLEGEYIEKSGELYIFDAVHIENQDMYDSSYAAVCAQLADAARALQNDKLKITNKKFITVDEDDSSKYYAANKAVIDDMSKTGDGLIIYGGAESPANDFGLRKIFKWKPIEHLTIDFYLKRIPERFEKKYGGPGYFLFNYCSVDTLGIIGVRKFEEYDYVITKQNGSNLIPIQFSPINMPMMYVFKADGKKDLDGKICEFALDVNKQKGTLTWRMVRVREDKAAAIEAGIYGNYFIHAEQIFNECIMPITLEMLFGGIESEDDYFQSSDNIYKDMRVANNNFKGQFFEKYAKNVNWLVDLAAGRADLGRYRTNGVKHVLMIDNDYGAMLDIMSRRVNFKAFHGENTILFYLQFDITRTFQEIVPFLVAFELPTTEIDKTSRNIKYEIDVLCCNMAIHYFYPNIANFINLVKLFIKRRGTFFYTCFDGKKVFDLLAENNGTWIVPSSDGTRDKYKIIAKYDTKAVSTFDGSKLLYIDVLMPFSNGELYQEALVDVVALNKQFEDAGFELIEKVDNEPKGLKEDDQFYSKLYCGSALKMK